MSDTVELLGERFRIAKQVGQMAIMRFAKVAQGGVDADTMQGLAALYDVLEQCIDPADWHAFEAHADKTRADGDQLLEVVKEVLTALGGRPTARSSDSSDGPRTIEPSSTEGSSSPAMRAITDLNERGRPDLALLVRKRQESLTA